MRRRILAVAVIAVVIAELVFALPLAFAVQRLLLSGQQEDLERQALRTAVAVSSTPQISWAGLDEMLTSDKHDGLYDLSRQRVAGVGPKQADDLVRRAESGNLAEGHLGDQQVAAVPVFSGGRVIAIVRAYKSRDLLTASVWGAWAAMLLLGVVAALIAAVLARRQARRLTEPLLRLEHGAEELGSGNFAVNVPPSDVGEIDRAGEALNRTAARLGDLMAREQNFTAYASHQLQTPLTALRLSLESALVDDKTDPLSTVRDALATVDRLAGTVDDVLMLTRGLDDQSRGSLDLASLLTDMRARWEPALAIAGRHLSVADEGAPRSLASTAAARQVLDVLVANALKHGRGHVTITARDASGALAIDVADEGSTRGHNLVQPATASRPAEVDDQTGRRSLGLGLAKALTEGEGGRLLHAWTQPTTRFTVLLPSERPAYETDTGLS